MTPALRKYHRIFWMGSAILMPVLFIASIAAIPEVVPAPLHDANQVEDLPRILKQSHETEFDLTIRSDARDSVRQLEVRVKEPISAPEVLIYLSDKMDASVLHGVFVGKLSSVGLYKFPLGSMPLPEPLVLTLYDPIHQRHYSTIQF